MNIIAADVGGTKAWFVVTDTDRPDQVLYEARYNSRDYDGFEPLLQAFIDDSGCNNKQLAVLSLALPGVVSGEIAKLTNLPWTISKTALQDAFGVGRIHFMNDFQASALGTRQLPAQDLVVLNQGVHNNEATCVAVGAGTGLGVSWMSSSGGEITAWSTEGGHVDFAPADDEQIGLLQFLAERYGHVSYERVLSGDGLVALYEFCSGGEGGAVDAAWVHAEAENKKNDAAVRAMTLFVRIYGAFVGNLALIFKPEGGIYITGGIAAKIITWMKSDGFITSFLNKGRMRAVTEQTSVYLVTNERVGVIGAVSEAVRQAGKLQ
ncbi:MAG: glucokinase [Thiotrichales bacterium]|nr:MAG: glucokinase [Thiotrichales bacterium]